jgi:hypothetical protein
VTWEMDQQDRIYCWNRVQLIASRMAYFDHVDIVVSSSAYYLALINSMSFNVIFENS